MSKPFGATTRVAPIDNPLMKLMCEFIQDETFPIHFIFSVDSSTCATKGVRYGLDISTTTIIPNRISLTNLLKMMYFVSLSSWIITYRHL